MPKVDLYNMKGEVVGDIQLCDNVFGAEVNKEVLHAVVVNQLANKRQGTQSTKTKSEVRGGGKKHGDKREPVVQDREVSVQHSGLKVV